METTTSEKERRSRTRRSALGRNVNLLPEDVRNIFLPLYRHGKLPTAFVLAFRGGSYQAGRNRLSKLYYCTQGLPTHYLERISPRWRYINPLYRDELYELGQKAEDELQAAGLIGHYKNPLQQKARMREMTNLPHTVMISSTTASIELAANRAATHRFFSWDQIIEHMPQDMRENEIPFAMKADISHRFGDRIDRKTYNLIPDGLFVLNDISTKEAIGFAVEAENRKQSGASNLTHTSFLKTFLGYRSISATKSYRPMLGKGADGKDVSLMVLVVTTSQRKIDGLKQVIMELTQGKGSSQFCFRAIPVLGSPDKAPKPDETLFTGGWQRAGHPDFFLNTLSDKPIA